MMVANNWGYSVPETSSPEDNGLPPDHAFNPLGQFKKGEAIRKFYDDVAREPVPQDMMELMAKLAKQINY